VARAHPNVDAHFPKLREETVPRLTTYLRVTLDKDVVGSEVGTGTGTGQRRKTQK
jgi:hypothetical protein